MTSPRARLALLFLLASGCGSALSQPDQAMRGWVTQLKKGDPSSKVTAARALGQMRAVAPLALTALEEATHDSDPAVRVAALEALGRLGPDANPAAGAVVAALSDKDKSVRTAAFEALGRIGTGAQAATGTLIDNLKSDAEELRAQSARALGKLGLVATIGETIVGGVRQAANPTATDKATIRELKTLDPIEGESMAVASDAVHDVAQGLANNERGQVQLAHDVARAVRALQRALSDRSEEVRQAAREALASIASERDNTPAAPSKEGP